MKIFCKNRKGVKRVSVSENEDMVSGRGVRGMQFFSANC